MVCCEYFQPTGEGASIFTVQMPRLTFGRGSLAETGARAQALGMTRIALITDAGLLSSELLATVIDSIKKAGLDHAVFSGIRVEPSDTSIQSAIKFISDGNFDGIVSVGGGSVMDSAKAAAIHQRYPSEFSDYFGAPVGIGKPVPGPVVPHIACPTTAGTGSECTGLSVIRIDSLNTKFVIASPYIMPDEAIVDPSCLDSLPGRVVASSGFDLLSHALECYTAKAYTQWAPIPDPSLRPNIQGANPWSDMSAREALNLVGRYIQRGVADSSDLEARDNLMWAATLAGMAFGNAGTHLPHALSYGVTHLMDGVTTPDYDIPAPFVPHGISVIVNSPSVFRYTADGAPERHLQAAEFMGFDIRDAGPADAGEVVAAGIIKLMRATDMPNGLGGVGFTLKDARALADSAARQGRAIANAPRDTNRNDIETMYERAMSYW